MQHLFFRRYSTFPSPFAASLRTILFCCHCHFHLSSPSLPTNHSRRLIEATPSSSHSSPSLPSRPCTALHCNSPSPPLSCCRHVLYSIHFPSSSRSLQQLPYRRVHCIPFPLPTPHPSCASPYLQFALSPATSTLLPFVCSSIVLLRVPEPASLFPTPTRFLSLHTHPRPSPHKPSNPNACDIPRFSEFSR